MAQQYNPIVRTFAQLRSALVRGAGLPRNLIRPDADLRNLLPEEIRRDVWNELRREGLSPDGLELRATVRNLLFLAVLLGTVAFVIGFNSWAGLFAIFPLAVLAYEMSRPWAVHFPYDLRTVGELTICLINFGEHRQSGYRWTRNEISVKVRMILALCLNHRLDNVRPEHTLYELGAE